MRRRACTLSLTLLGLVGCGEDIPDDTASAVYHSMEQCLIGIRQESGSELEVYQQSASHVVGKLATTGLAFACHQLPSEDGFIEIEGWYLLEPPAGS